MDKLLLLCGFVMLGTTTTPQEEIPVSQIEPQTISLTSCQEEEYSLPVLMVNSDVSQGTPEFLMETKRDIPRNLDLNDIVFIEKEEPIDLGFDTEDYLPLNFDPYKVYFDLDKVTYIEDGEDEVFDFDTSGDLPKDFNPYAHPEDFAAVSFIEEEEELTLGFDPKDYLPAGFDPYEVYFDLDAVEYIEDDEEVELDFNTKDYLPSGFDPYTR